MTTIKRFVPNGFTLIEALVSILVVGVGVLGLAKMNGNLLQGTGLSKTRADAIQIAQQQLELARNAVAGGGCTALPTTTQTSNVSGVSSYYTLNTNYSASGTTGNMEIAVTVAWTDNDNDATNNQVILRSVVSCLTSSDSALVDGGTGVGNFIKNPTGRGKVGGDTYPLNAIPGTANTIPGTELADGTKTNIKQDGTVELIDATGQVQLTFVKTECEKTAASDTGFSTVSGKLFIKANNQGKPIVDADNLFVLSSDASYCSLLDFSPEDTPSWVLPANTTGKDIDYFYTYYKCYIGPEWWGNVGVVRTDNAPTNNRVCVGNPISTNINTIFSKHAQRNTTRGYRGYSEVSTGVYESQGIGVDDSTCAYTAKHYTEHHFVISSGIQDDSSCLAEEQIVTGAVLGNNPGKFFCMTSIDGVSCPDLTGTSTPPSTTISGTISRYDEAELTGIVAGSACTTASFGGSTSYNYTCNINWTGFTGASWSGVLAFTAGSNATLCPEGSQITVSPNETLIAYVINNKDATLNPNSITFTDIPKSVTSVNLDFSVKINSCASLAQPNVQWVGTSPKTLDWDPIIGASLYRIFTCTETNNNSLTQCTPTTQTITTEETQFAPGGDPDNPGDPGNKNTICIIVQAANDTENGIMSPLKCVHRKNNDYTYLVN